MGMPVKLSDDPVRAARAEAKATDRSITAQIGHWAKLGRATPTVRSRATAVPSPNTVPRLSQ